MFSTPVNTRDLFYSNPVDHFLGNDAGLRTSLESGFSSSFGHSQHGHSKELGGNSEDIFTQTSRNSLNDLKSANSDYQKYISQNLLFGKKNKMPKFGAKTKDNEFDEKEIHSTTELDSDRTKEIKDIVVKLYSGMQKISSDVSDLKDSNKEVERAIVHQNEKMRMLEEAFSKQSKMVESNENNWKKYYKEDNATKLQKNIKEVRRINEKLKISVDTSQNKLFETVKKLFANQENSKLTYFEDLKSHNEHILRNIEIKTDQVHKSFQDCLEKFTRTQEEILEKKINDLKGFTDSSNSTTIQKIVSQKYMKSNSPLLKAIHLAKPKSPPSNASFYANQYNFLSPSNAFNETNFALQDEKATWENRGSSLRSTVHTPLVDVMNRGKASARIDEFSSENHQVLNKKNMDGFNRSPYIFRENRCFQPKQVTRKCTQFNIKRKLPTPITTPSQQQPDKRMFRNSNKISSAFMKGVHGNKKIFQKDNLCENLRTAKHQRKGTTTQSSPYMTVYEATTMAEKYSFM